MEKWKDIEGFPGYQVSDQGRVRTFWKKVHNSTGYGTHRELGENSTIMSQSDDGNGYMKVMLYNRENDRRSCKKVHRLVAETFIPCNDPNATVDHVRSGRESKKDNSVDNLQWLSRSDNIKKAYRDGMCDYRILRQRKGVMMRDLWTGEERYYPSIGDAARELNLDRSGISHVLLGRQNRVSHYTFEYASGEDRLLYGFDNY